jgi:hypothetical protein
VYLQQPEGLALAVVVYVETKPLRYKASTTVLNKRFISFMEEVGLKKSTADPCLFYRAHEDSFLCVAIYVDDGLVVTTKTSAARFHIVR